MTSNRDNAQVALRQITGELLSLKDDHKLRAAVEKLSALLSCAADLDGSYNLAANDQDTTLASGKAISPGGAARCILDYRRTAKFVEGIRAAIVACKRRFPGQTTEILYAGCGPLAPFAVTMATQFSAGEIQFTLLDVHQESIAYAKRLFEFFNLGSVVKEFVCGDAAVYQHPADRSLHLVIVEAMQGALAKEPQVAIVVNLAPQLCDSGILIPERVTVDVCLADLEREFSNESLAENRPDQHSFQPERIRIHLGRLFELSALPPGRPSCQPEGDPRFSPVIVEIPPDVTGNLRIALLTGITIFESIKLEEYESGLTHPVALHDLGTARAATRIEFSYALGHDPGFRYRLLTPSEAKSH